MNRDQIWDAAFQGNKAVIESFMKDPNVNIFHAKSSALFLAAAGHHLELVKMLLAKMPEKRDITNDAVYHLNVATDKEYINRAITFLLRIPNTIDRQFDRRIMKLWNNILIAENGVFEKGKILYMTMIELTFGRYNEDNIKDIVKFWSEVYETSSVIDTKESTLKRFLDNIKPKPSHVRTEGCPCRNCQVQFRVAPKCYKPDTSTLKRTRIDTLCFGLCNKKNNGLCRENDCRCHCDICTDKWIKKVEQNTTLSRKSFIVNTFADDDADDDEVDAKTRVRFDPNVIVTDRAGVKSKQK